MFRKAILLKSTSLCLLAIKSKIAQITADACAPESSRLCNCGGRVIGAHPSADAWRKGHKHRYTFSGDGSSALMVSAKA